MKKRLEFVQGSSAKFWEISRSGLDLTVTFGRIGTAGQTQYRSFASAAAAQADAEKQVGAKVKKGYRETSAKNAKPAATSKLAKSTKPAKAAAPAQPPLDFPFPFIGQGLAASYKCLECYFLFERPPSKKEQEQIKALLPAPLTSLVKFRGDVLLFASDDELELRIKATYEPPHSAKPFKQALRDVYAIAKAKDFSDDVLFPKKRYWQAFCDDFDAKARAIHAISKIKLAVKPDNDEGALSFKPGPWHRWSLGHLHKPFEDLVAENRKPSPELAYLTVNIIEALPAKMPPNVLAAWLMWIDRLRSAGRPKELVEAGDWDEAAKVLFEGVAKRDREQLLAPLSRSMRTLLLGAPTEPR